MVRPRSTLWSALRLKGMHREALAAAKVYYASYGAPGVDAALDRGHAEADYAGAMRRAAMALAARFRETYVAPGHIADLYLEAGDKAQALEWLEKGFEVRDPNMPYIRRNELRSLALRPALPVPPAPHESPSIADRGHHRQTLFWGGPQQI